MRSLVSSGCDTFSTPSDTRPAGVLQLEDPLDAGRRQPQAGGEVDDVLRSRPTRAVPATWRMSTATVWPPVVTGTTEPRP